MSQTARDLVVAVRALAVAFARTVRLDRLTARITCTLEGHRIRRVKVFGGATLYRCERCHHVSS